MAVSFLYTDPIPAMQFTVNNAVAEVTITPDVTDDIRLNFINQVGNFDRRYFQYADNIVIQSITLLLPYCFNVGLNPARFAIQLQTATGVGGGYLQGYGLNNRETINPDTLINPLDSLGVNEKWTLNIVDSFFSISQIGVPDILNATAQQIYLMFKIKHTLGLIA